MEQSSRIPKKRVDDAYNIVLLENEKDKAQKQLNPFSSAAKEVGGVINIDKIKVLLKSIETKPEIKLDETVLGMVDVLQYLGAWVKDSMKDFKSNRNIKYGKIKMI